MIVEIKPLTGPVVVTTLQDGLTVKSSTIDKTTLFRADEIISIRQKKGTEEDLDPAQLTLGLT